MSESPCVTRFAPSPTGELHLGNARTALFNALLAWSRGGHLLLRIEDTDLARSRAEFTTTLMDDLAWLGISWHGEPLHQSVRAAIYNAELVKLGEKGLVYPCFCTPRELALERATQLAAGRPPRYSGRCRRLSSAELKARMDAGEPASMRFAVPEEGAVEFDDLVHGRKVVPFAQIGDFVLRRADGSAAFFFSNAVDDALCGVTHLLRGDDHLSNTPRQLLILSALGLPAPRYGHLALLTGSDGVPLSKRSGAASLRALREEGLLPRAILNHLFRLGHSTSRKGLLGLAEMAGAFEVAHLQRSPAHSDPAQLLAWQKEAVHRLTPAEASAWLGSRLPPWLDVDERNAFLAAVLPNLLRPDDVLPWVEVVFGAPPEPQPDAAEVIAAADRRLFQAATAAADGNDFAAIVTAARAATGLGGPALFRPLRAALTGRLAGPELGPLLRAMPPNAARARLARYA